MNRKAQFGNQEADKMREIGRYMSKIYQSDDHNLIQQMESLLEEFDHQNDLHRMNEVDDTEYMKMFDAILGALSNLSEQIQDYSLDHSLASSLNLRESVAGLMENPGVVQNIKNFFGVDLFNFEKEIGGLEDKEVSSIKMYSDLIDRILNDTALTEDEATVQISDAKKGFEGLLDQIRNSVKEGYDDLDDLSRAAKVLAQNGFIKESNYVDSLFYKVASSRFKISIDHNDFDAFQSQLDELDGGDDETYIGNEFDRRHPDEKYENDPEAAWDTKETDPSDIFDLFDDEDEKGNFAIASSKNKKKLAYSDVDTYDDDPDGWDEWDQKYNNHEKNFATQQDIKGSNYDTENPEEMAVNSLASSEEVEHARLRLFQGSETGWFPLSEKEIDDLPDSTILKLYQASLDPDRKLGRMHDRGEINHALGDIVASLNNRMTKSAAITNDLNQILKQEETTKPTRWNQNKIINLFKK